MAIEDWIDKLTAVWATVGDGGKGKVLSYSVFGKSNFPEDLSQFPCAITYPQEMSTQYSLGGPLIDFWRGVTEFHLYPNTQKANLPGLIKYFARIRNAAAGSMTLGGTVSWFQLRSGQAAIVGPVVLQYGSENPHHGLVVHWEVKDNVSGDFTPAA